MEAKVPQRERSQLLVQVQPWSGPLLPKEGLVPPASSRGGLVFGYLGDLQVRFVFEDPGEPAPSLAQPQHLERLGLTPGKALAQAVVNLRTRVGTPDIGNLGDGLRVLRSPHTEYVSALLLDRNFWRQQLVQHPQGILAALPRRGVLLFAPVGDAAADKALVQQGEKMLAAAGTAATSSCVFRFDATGWHVQGRFKTAPAPTAAPAPARAARPRDDDDDDEDDDGPPRRSRAGGDLDYDKAGGGLRVLLACVPAGIVLAVLNFVLHLNPAWIAPLTGALALVAAIGVVRLGAGLGRSTAAKIGCMVLGCVPIVNVLTWIALGVQGVRALRDAGHPLGLPGFRS